MSKDATYIVKHERDDVAVFVEYGDRKSAEESAVFLAGAHGGAATVYYAQKLGSVWRGDEYRHEPVERSEKGGAA